MTDNIETQIIEHYTNKMKPAEIGKLLNVGNRRIFRILKRNNITLHKHIKENFKCELCGGDTKSKTNILCNSCKTKVRRFRAKQEGVRYLGNKCKECDWTGDISGYDFHHRTKEEKLFELTATTMASTNWETVKLELDKCDLLCAICHRKKHSSYDTEHLIEVYNSYNGIIFKAK